MSFHLDRLQAEIAGAPLCSPYPLDLALAILNDCFRMAGKAPVPDAAWKVWPPRKRSLWPEQVGMLAHFLASTSLRDATVKALAKAKDRRPHLQGFFDKVQPLTAEMIRANRFRQEEFLRRWAEWCGASISGETRSASAERMEQLDYRKTMSEFAASEAARVKAEGKRRKLLEEARQRETAARGWRE